MKSNYFLLIPAVIFLSSCASIQKEISFNELSLDPTVTNIAITTSNIPEASVKFPGADCLLCIGVAMAAHSELREHTSTLKTDELIVLPKLVQKKLENKGFKTKLIENYINLSKLKKAKNSGEGFAKRDFSSYKKFGTNKVFVLNYYNVGYKRQYQNYFASGPVMAQIKANVFIVDIESGKLELYKDLDVTSASRGEWDEPPSFPGLTNSYFANLEKFKDSVNLTIK